jgi:predicted MPP superfamily phosphohydrolase
LEFYSFLPLTAAIILTALFWRVGLPFRAAWAAMGVITVLCSLADWVLLGKLPQLRLSFGPVSPPLFMFNFIRLLPLLLAVLVIGAAAQTWQRLLIILAVCLFQVLFLVAGYHSLYLEPFRLRLSEISLDDAPGFLPDRPVRILQLSDLHVEHLTAREEAVFQRTQALSPDLIVLTGDYINKSFLKDPQTRQETREWLSKLSAPYGVYAVNGNLDSPALMAALFEGLDNIRVLNNEIVPISFPGGMLYLAGATAAHHSRDYYTIDALLDGLPSDAYSVLLFHYPERVDVASKRGVNLMLAGDTHGGQVRLPVFGAVATRNMWHSYIMGRYEVGPTTLYVSRGLGMQGGIWPRVRMNCPPEMVLINLGK